MYRINFVDMERTPGNNYVKIDGRWVIAPPECNPENNVSTFTLTKLSDLKARKSHANSNARQDRQRQSSPRAGIIRQQPMIRNIQGTKKERRTNESLSDAIQKLQFSQQALEIKGVHYCSEFYAVLMDTKIQNISGTMQQHVFNMLQKMLATVLNQGSHVWMVKSTLLTACKALCSSENEYLIGSRNVWRKHRETVNNCIIKVTDHQYQQREDDGKPALLDLPKETLINIMSRLSDPADVLSLTETCTDLQYIALDSYIWRSLCFYHFKDKQIGTFIQHRDLDDVQWLDVFKACKRKYKVLRKCYGDELVLCDNCRSVYWRLYGHDCVNTDNAPSHTCLSPTEFLDLFHL